MKDSLISVGTSPYFKEEAEQNFMRFASVFKECQDIRRCGSASLDLANVACGRIDAYMENHLKIWDYCRPEHCLYVKQMEKCIIIKVKSFSWS